jgi:hypothetical protein
VTFAEFGEPPASAWFLLIFAVALVFAGLWAISRFLDQLPPWAFVAAIVALLALGILFVTGLLG